MACIRNAQDINTKKTKKQKPECQSQHTRRHIVLKFFTDKPNPTNCSNRVSNYSTN